VIKKLGEGTGVRATTADSDSVNGDGDTAGEGLVDGATEALLTATGGALATGLGDVVKEGMGLKAVAGKGGGGGTLTPNRST
jgi:hypothetical protein